MSSTASFITCPWCGGGYCREEIDLGLHEVFLFCYDCFRSARIPWED
ncbi:MAG: hypothetical protein ACPLRW_05550 [Moorellales bacterium]